MFRDGRLTRYGQTMAMVFGMFVLGLAAAVYLATHKPQGEDNTTLITSILGFVSVILIGLMNKAQGQRVEDVVHEHNQILHGQNETLAEIKTDVKSKPGEADLAIAAIREEWRRERHNLNNQLVTIQMQLTESEAKLKEKTEAAIKLEATTRELTEKLAACACTATKA